MNPGIFVALLFCERELVGDFGGEMGLSPLGFFSKPSAINEFGMPLPTSV